MERSDLLSQALEQFDTLPRGPKTNANMNAVSYAVSLNEHGLFDNELKAFLKEQERIHELQEFVTSELNRAIPIIESITLRFTNRTQHYTKISKSLFRDIGDKINRDKIINVNAINQLLILVSQINNKESLIGAFNYLQNNCDFMLYAYNTLYQFTNIFEAPLRELRLIEENIQIAFKNTNTTLYSGGRRRTRRTKKRRHTRKQKQNRNRRH
jgi:hypothetical protein